jgi:hypothetical protein
MLHSVFRLSLWEVERLLAERGAVVSYEAARRWCKKFGTRFSDRVRRQLPPPGDEWCVDGRGLHPEPRRAALSLRTISVGMDGPSASCARFGSSSGKAGTVHVPDQVYLLTPGRLIGGETGRSPGPLA